MNSIEEILEELKNGRMVVILDDEDRENEGDLIMCAPMTRPEDINFMARYGRGLICLSLTKERCEQLQLPLMVNQNDARYSTNFTISIEAAEGVTTGISAYDRAHTVRTAVKPNALPEELVQPGHIFPLMAQSGGVLTRAGHTEAGVDLARLAGMEPAAVIVEILNEDGTMARRPELEEFAREHDLKIGTVAALIQYRLKTEKTVRRVFERQVETDFGSFNLVAYRDIVEKETHVALVKGDISPSDPPLVRVHLQNTLSDALFIQDHHFGLPLRIALREIASQESGVVVILGEHVTEMESLIEDFRTFEESPEEDDETPASVTQIRTYGIGAQILCDLGVRKMRVLSAPKHFHGLAGFGLEITDYVEPGEG